MRRYARVLIAFAAVAFYSLPAASTAPAGALTRQTDPLFWEGSFTGALGEMSQDFTLEIELPSGTWSRDGGVQVGVHWQYDTNDLSDLDIQVLDGTGKVIASSGGRYEDTASVLLRRPANGVYTVRVVPYRVSANGVHFRGLAEVEYRVAPHPRRELLPNLRPLPQRQVRTTLPDGTTCTNLEIAEENARKCLRFEQIVFNAGEGPVELRYRIDPLAETAPALPGVDGNQVTVLNQPMDQRIYHSDGTWFDRLADHYEFHPAHAHMHYRNFATSRIWAADAAGTLLGTAPVRQSRKQGFCLIDVENVRFGEKGDAAHTYHTCPPELRDPGEVGTNGISVGWADVYGYNLDGQYIEISDVPDGYYMLETIVDPANTLREADETDNAVMVLLRLLNNGTSVEIVR